MDNYRGQGKRIKWTNTTGIPQLADSVQVIGSAFGILVTATAAAVVGSLDVCDDERQLAVDPAITANQGDPAYWDAGNQRLTNVAAGNTGGAYFSKPVVQGSTTACIIRRTPAVAAVVNVPVDACVTVAKLAAAVQDMIPQASVAAGAPNAHKATVTISVKDAAGNALAQRSLVKVWISSTSFGAPVATANTIDNVAAGTLIDTLTAGASIIGMTEAAGGTFVFDLSNAGAASRYVMVEIGGKVVASALISL